jgi:hypothetical protein
LADFANSELKEPRDENLIKSPERMFKREELPVHEEDHFDEFQAFGILLLHLVLTFPGQPK